MLRGKVGLVIGAANKHSIAWGVVQSLVNQGMRVHVFCQSDRFVNGLKKLGETSLDNSNEGCLGMIQTCDLSDDQSIFDAFESLKISEGSSIDTMVHAVAHAPATAMQGSLLDTTREDFSITHDISSYSLIAASRAIVPLMNKDIETGSSITTLSYLGSTKVVPKYNVMGCAKASLESVSRGLAYELGTTHNIRVNCINPGPISSLAARGIKDFVEMKNESIRRSPLHRTASTQEVGEMAAFLASSSGRSITGQVLYMDGGLSSMAP